MAIHCYIVHLESLTTRKIAARKNSRNFFRFNDLLGVNKCIYHECNYVHRPYYEMKAQFNQMLEEQKTRVSVLERSVGEAKMTYAEALRNLEKISDEIHRVRNLKKNIKIWTKFTKDRRNNWLVFFFKLDKKIRWFG